MKIKTDFVTNSSSSSFVVIGEYISADDIPERYLESAAEQLGMTIDAIKDDRYELFGILLSNSGLSYSRGSDYDEEDIMVGIEYSNMDDNETLLNFKNRVQLLIFEKLGIPTKPHHIEECWMDN